MVYFGIQDQKGNENINMYIYKVYFFNSETIVLFCSVLMVRVLDDPTKTAAVAAAANRRF